MSTDKQAFKKDPMSPTGLMQAGSFHIWQMPGGHGSVLDAVRPPLSPRGPARSVRFPAVAPGTKPSDLKVPPFLKRKPLFPFPNLNDKNHDGSLAGVFAKMGSDLSDEQKELIERGHGVKIYKCGHESRCRCAHDDLPAVQLNEPCYDCEKQAAESSINANRNSRDLIKHSIDRGHEKQAVGANIRRAAQMARNAFPSLVGKDWRKAVPIVKQSPTLLAEGRKWPLQAPQVTQQVRDRLRAAAENQARSKQRAFLAANPQAPFEYRRFGHKYFDTLLEQDIRARLAKVDSQMQKMVPMLRRHQQVLNQQADNLAISGRHTKKILPYADDTNVPATTSGVTQQLFGTHDFGNLSKKELPRTLWQKLTFQRPVTYEVGHVPENIYKGLNSTYPQLRIRTAHPDDAQWFSGLPQVAQRGGYADPYLWELPTAQVPKSWHWNRTFTPHVADDFSKKTTQQILESYRPRETFGFGNSSLDYHPLYETVARVPIQDADAPLRMGRLFKKLPSGRAFQQLTDKT